MGRRGRRLKARRGDVLAAVIDLDTVSGTTPDGRRYAGQVDPQTGLLLAEGIRPPRGTVIAMGDRAAEVTGLELGDCIVLQRDLGRCFEWEGMTVQRLSVVQPCTRCKSGWVTTGKLLARVTADGYYQGAAGRVVDLVADAHQVSELAIKAEDTGLDWTEGGLGYVPGTGSEWVDGGEHWVSLRLVSWCGQCGRRAQDDTALVGRW